ncbi:MAG TPA: ThiF family adenylyltransferase [Pyrinomonadaceae bacterium]|jgi:PRTRC genetic system ThiF family protein
MKPKNNILRKSQTLDLSYARAAQVVPGGYDHLRLVLVGCGGTGSFLAPSVARLARVLQDAGRDVSVLFVDHDIVEDKNIPRQNFCLAELGMNKAVTLAARCSIAWNMEIGSIPEKFSDAALGNSNRFSSLTVLIGCVDNAAARRAINAALRQNVQRRAANLWWLDCGNLKEAGQVMLGCATKESGLKGAFPTRTICTALPSPAMQAPDLLVPRPEELSGHKLSCAELAMLNAQSLMVNQYVAAVAADYLLKFTTGQLNRFATYFDLASMTTKSLYVTPDEVARVIAKPPEFLMAEIGGRKRRAA